MTYVELFFLLLGVLLMAFTGYLQWRYAKANYPKSGNWLLLRYGTAFFAGAFFAAGLGLTDLSILQNVVLVLSNGVFTALLLGAVGDRRMRETIPKQNESDTERDAQRALDAYIMTLWPLLLVASFHLDDAAFHIDNITWQTAVEVFPMFFLVGAIVLLLSSIFLINLYDHLAARLAMIASVFAWVYYGLMIAALPLPVDPPLSRLGFIVAFVSLIPLYFSFRRSKRILREVAST